ncbi:hypothetical protein BKG81_20875 [Mycobacteroides chelonae]|jgi:hypothetical protein|nr:hypothetical protein BKG81_20875 [Mycobacteroides chelonae]
MAQQRVVSAPCHGGRMAVSELASNPVALAAIAIGVLIVWKLRKAVMLIGLLAAVVLLVAMYR